VGLFNRPNALTAAHDGYGRIVQIKQRGIIFREYWGSLCVDGNLLYSIIRNIWHSKSSDVYLFIEEKGKQKKKKKKETKIKH
jgi:hypothetical protein